MKKNKIVLFLLVFVATFFMGTHVVHAEAGKDILKSVALYTQTSDFKTGDKMIFNVSGTEEISRMTIDFYNPVSLDGHIYGYFQMDMIGTCNGKECTFNGYIPQDTQGYYQTEDGKKDIYVYPGTYEVSAIKVYDKKNNVTEYSTDKARADEDENVLYYESKIKINIKEPPKDILKSLALYTQTSNYYLGDKMIFNVDSTEDIYAMNIMFYNPVSLDGHIYGHFTVYATRSCSAGETTNCPYVGYIPKTIAGYYGTTENGRTEQTIYAGTYHINSIFCYSSTEGLIRYTTKKDFAEQSDYLYYPHVIEVNISEPTGDELNDVEFVLEKFNLKKQSGGIGGEVPVEVKYTYDSSNKKVKSLYLIFKDASKNRTFTTYVKSLTKNPYFVVASSADTGTYTLDSVGVTFEDNDGTNNTILLNANSNSGKYSKIFSQTLTVKESNGDTKLYFSANELNDEVYRRIEESEDDSIVIDAEFHTVIPHELFNIIKDSNKKLVIVNNNIEWVFDGKDIKNPKSIDVLLKAYQASASDLSDNLKKVLSGESVVLEFPDNGELPGNVLIRIKDKEILNKLSGKEHYIYYIDTDNNKLSKVALSVEKNADGYLEFYINHNSKYVISNTEVKDLEVLGEDDTLLEKNDTLVEETKAVKNGANLFIIIAIVMVAICVISGVVIILRKGKKQTPKEEKK